ncbi:MAG: bifunctional DNA-formamidopyrimidine glycosylase/DNA-(apurinic or apyrimidinic site) lyase [Patescibacteria group bacterium]
MPELPEVETIRLGLNQELVGRNILAVEVRLAKLFRGDQGVLVGAKILDITRRAKLLIWRLEKSWLLIHLKMTGQLIFVPNSKTNQLVIGGHPDIAYDQPPPHRHTHITIKFNHGTLYFNDLRQFGWFKILHSAEELKNELAKYGPEYDWPEFNLTYWRSILGSPLKTGRSRIKQVLLDQSLIAGIGNIYSDEILFEAGVLPKRLAGELSEEEAARLYRSIPKILKLALRYGGTSSSDYRQLDGSRGAFLSLAKVYGRAGRPCKVCATTIERVKVAGRSSCYCPTCQR